MRPTSHIEISKEAIKHNVNFIQDLVGDEVTFSSVVKGNAYGHGIDIFCPIAYESGVRHFSTFSADEAERVMKVVPKDCQHMIMGMIFNDQIEWAIEHGVEFYVFDIDRLKATIKAAKKVGKAAKVHLELETGMNRTGFNTKQFRLALDLVEDHPEELDFKGVCTHFAGAESIANYHRIMQQRSRFKRMVQALESRDIAPPFIHAACSAAAVRYSSSRYNLVRIGILQYGFFPSREIAGYYVSKLKKFEDPLKRIISWKSRVMDTKKVKAGEFIGYGTSFYTNIDTEIALVPVGYAHGFSRSLSNQGKVIIRGRRLSVIGMVNMNMMAVDITEAEGIEKGDEVILIGKQGDCEISVASFGDYSHQVNYELLTRLPSDIPRIVT